MVGEVRLAEHVQPGHVAHQVVVDPEPTHRVVDGGVDAHRHLVRVLVGDALVHLEQVAVALLDDVLAEALDRLGEVEVHAVLLRTRRRDRRRPRAWSRATRRRAARGCRTRGSGARGSSRARRPGSGRASAVSSSCLGTHTRPSLRSDSDISVSFDWKSSLRRDARGVDLREARVGEQRALAVRPPRRGDVARLGVGRQEEDVAVAAGAEHDGVRRLRLHRAGDQVAGDDAGGAAVLHHEVEHLAAV